METKELMSGIAVAIDDAFRGGSGAGSDARNEDRIEGIVRWFEKEWQLPFVKEGALPKKESWPNLLRAASFVLLDWQLWGQGGEALRRSTIADIEEFLTAARQNLVPVFILTNTDPGDVRDVLGGLSVDESDERAAEAKFAFVEQKAGFWDGTSVDVTKLESWVYGNASVYTLKAWERVLEGAKHELFQAMCQRNVNWPRVFWDSYRLDSVDPSASLTNLINDSLRGRMRADGFEEEHLSPLHPGVSAEQLRGLIAEASFRGNAMLPSSDVRSGDLFKGTQGKFWLNLRPDCDCIPRGGETIEDIHIHCVRGRKISSDALNEKFSVEYGQFRENISESIVFGVVEGDSLIFNFGKLCLWKYSELRDRRLGRLLHPHLTRVQQRYALYLQRQALPRIPDAAVRGAVPDQDACEL